MVLLVYEYVRLANYLPTDKVDQLLCLSHRPKETIGTKVFSITFTLTCLSILHIRVAKLGPDS